jgi:hypothetical protein
MTRLAFGAKCGAENPPAASTRGFNNEASAAVPMPTLLRPRNCRRVT